MSLVVIAFPNISAEDYEWIQKIRRQHDSKKFNVVKPHVTIIFPTTKLDSNSLARHIENHLTGLEAFPVVFDSVRVVEDFSKTYSQAFLVPSAGYNEISKLHDLLYVDEMASELRSDILFIPHVSIGTNEDRFVMQRLASSVRESNKSVSGTIDKLTVCEYDGNKVTDLTAIPLK